MSDSGDDEAKRSLQFLVINVYADLHRVCAALPIPIALPVGKVDLQDLVDAASRSVDLIEDEPVSDFQKAALSVACIRWVAAAYLTGIEGNPQNDQVRMIGATANLADAVEALRDYTHPED
ncbi:hypothetical protein ACEZCY_14635 [Streptacidiphilus sp. N1-12]|uniref:Uncharacterized protein n=2 Tax=Streptacidiphilus alkalitolerans TaxID=3342712 RepID=A0ABV6V9U2_9ACTN